MPHMPYERFSPGDVEESTSKKYVEKESPPQGEPRRTPQSAEGEDGEERKVPEGEPGRTPGSAEGEDESAPRS